MRTTPRQPKNVPKYAVLCLKALVDGDLAGMIVLSGGVGLAHYLDFRPTLDIDAWWADEVTADEQHLVTETIENTLKQFGEVRKRAWGDVVSLELLQEGHKTFSFQVARRSAQLLPAIRAPWVDVPLDSFEDIVASKMVALVERGAPRDFRDIYMLCQAGLSTPVECWQLWQRQQELAGSDEDFERARLAIITHLEDIDDKVDFLARLCSAWDFGILPEPLTIDEIRKADWREAVDRCRLLSSPTYHLLREWHALDSLPYLGQKLAYIQEDPSLEYV